MINQSIKTIDGMNSAPLLRVRNLRAYFDTDLGVVKAVDGVSFDIFHGETLALVGESGCGKSVTAMSILRLLPMPPARILADEITFDGESLLNADEARMRGVRGNDIAMIFQEPMTSLNPVYTIGDQIIEAVTLHQGVRHEAARARAIEMLDRVGIPAPGQRIDEYPHQLSGGMRQRAMIAMALSCNPQLLIADEPTTALDVTIQAQILDLLRDLQREFRMSILLITHDMGVVAEVARRVMVMYAGKVAETAGVHDLFKHPRHPYTAGLFHSVPKLDADEEQLQPIEGVVPDALHLPAGCKFHPRCLFAWQKCREEEPALTDMKNAAESGEPRAAACWHTIEQPGADLLAETAERHGAIALRAGKAGP